MKKKSSLTEARSAAPGSPFLIPRYQQRHLAFVFGVVFVVVLVVLAIAVPNPTPFQYTVFRVLLALAAAGVAATIPGFLQVTIADWLRVGGALAVFVIVFFYNPAALVVVQEPRPGPAALFTKEGDGKSDSARDRNFSPRPVAPEGTAIAPSPIRSETARALSPPSKFPVTRARKSSLPPPQNAFSYRLNLLIPTSMSNAAVSLDGREARILKRTAILITIEVPAGDSNHQIRLEKEGRRTCAETISVTKDGMTLTPCQL
ncbi:MAG TPA: hypothetical protein VOA87_05255 [Thermoanaerobaculia bacterium]|nr:hypothetical protein [Thermoanaerobaculia bacterium]